MVCFVVTQHNESELSLCLRYSKTSCEATQNKILTKNFFLCHPLRGLLLDDDAEGGAVMGFGGFDEEAFLATTKLESMV